MNRPLLSQLIYFSKNNRQILKEEKSQITHRFQRLQIEERYTFASTQKYAFTPIGFSEASLEKTEEAMRGRWLRADYGRSHALHCGNGVRK